jgi:hypothetical protein
MRRHGRIARTLAVCGVALLGVLTSASAGGATTEAVTRCADLPVTDGWAGHREIVGDLVVDAEGCRLTKVHITGDVLVETGGLSLTRSTIRGDVRLVAASARIQASTVLGGVSVDEPDGGVEVWYSSVRRSIRGSARYVYVRGSDVDGAVNVATTGGVSVYEGSTVGGWVNVHGGRLHLVEATLERGLTSFGLSEAVMCGARVGGDVTVRRAHAAFELGRWGASTPCDTLNPDARTSIGGSLTIEDNPHSVLLATLTVAGDLVCTGNTGPRGLSVLPSVEVAGARIGQCA